MKTFIAAAVRPILLPAHAPISPAVISPLSLGTPASHLILTKHASNHSARCIERQRCRQKYRRGVRSFGRFTIILLGGYVPPDTRNVTPAPVPVGMGSQIKGELNAHRIPRLAHLFPSFTCLSYYSLVTPGEFFCLFIFLPSQSQCSRRSCLLPSLSLLWPALPRPIWLQGLRLTREM